MISFSIIIPVCNAAAYLRVCLDSVVAQTFEDWECICVDDGSTDDSPGILEEFASRSSRFRILRQENAGVSAARNVGLAQAAGEYVCFVDADDRVSPDWLAHYAAALRDRSYDFVRIRRPWWTDTPGEIAAEDTYRWMWRTVLPEGFPWTYCVRREVALKASFPSGVAMSEDSIYLARLAPFVKSARQLDTDGYEHVVHGDSAMFRKLSSAERVACLSAWRELSERLDMGAGSEAGGCAAWRKAQISHFVTDGILAWLSRPEDTVRRGEIRRLWRDLHARGCADARSVRPLFRWAYRSYATTGLLWPPMAWNLLIGAVVRIKNGSAAS